MKLIRICLYMSICFYGVETKLYGMDGDRPSSEPNFIARLRTHLTQNTPAHTPTIQPSDPSSKPLRVQAVKLEHSIEDANLKSRMRALYRRSSPPNSRRSSPDHYATFYE